LRIRHPHLSDLIFVGVMGYFWLVHSFAVCRGDIRLGYTMGLFLGCWGWEMTFGRWLRPLFYRIWMPILEFFSFFRCRVKKFFNFLAYFPKKLFASAKKWVTIQWNNRCHPAAATGGTPHGKTIQYPRPGQSGIPQKR
jgi:hypothetical protein